MTPHVTRTLQVHVYIPRWALHILSSVLALALVVLLALIVVPRITEHTQP